MRKPPLITPSRYHSPYYARLVNKFSYLLPDTSTHSSRPYVQVHWTPRRSTCEMNHRYRTRTHIVHRGTLCELSFELYKPSYMSPHMYLCTYPSAWKSYHPSRIRYILGSFNGRTMRAPPLFLVSIQFYFLSSQNVGTSYD